MKEIDSITRKDTTSQVHSILKEVLFIVASDKIRSQNKNKQQLNDSLTESWTSWVYSVIFIWYDLLLVLFCEKKLVRLNKATCTTFLSTNITEYSSLEKYFIKWAFHVKLKWMETLETNEYEEFIKKAINKWWIFCFLAIVILPILS